MIIYICHDQSSIDVCNIKSPDAQILLVGPNDAVSKFPDKLTVVRNLPFNIEEERKLLTFTAWYAIIKNDLFSDTDILCLLEWDATLTASIPDITYDVVFLMSFSDYFLNDISPNILTKYLGDRGLYINKPGEIWGSSTNVILRRHVLKKFVDLYYPSCIVELKKDIYNFSYYHERVFSMFVKTNKFFTIILPIVLHLQSNSHASFR